jgi:hypothetical protein
MPKVVVALVSSDWSPESSSALLIGQTFSPTAREYLRVPGGAIVMVFSVLHFSLILEAK